MAGLVQHVCLLQRDPVFPTSHAPLAHALQKRPATKRTKVRRMATIESPRGALTAMVNNAALRRGVFARRVKADQVIAEGQRNRVSIRVLGRAKEAVERIDFHWVTFEVPQARLVTKVARPVKVSQAPRVVVRLVSREMANPIFRTNRKVKAKVLRKKDRPKVEEEHQGRAEKNPSGPMVAFA